MAREPEPDLETGRVAERVRHTQETIDVSTKEIKVPITLITSVGENVITIGLSEEDREKTIELAVERTMKESRGEATETNKD
jgi:hypothetical protein